jgi:hypothetical protein
MPSTDSLQAYPNISVAARILGVAASTLSRRSDIAVEARGERDRALPPGEVLRLGLVFRRRSLNDVAQDLLDYAREAAPGEVTRVEEEIERFFEGHAIQDEQLGEFLALAHRLLPPQLAQEVEAVVRGTGGELPDVVIGWHPVPDQ